MYVISKKIKKSRTVVIKMCITYNYILTEQKKRNPEQLHIKLLCDTDNEEIKANYTVQDTLNIS